jgi:hypothetical protein
VIASPLRPRHRQESGIAAASRLAHRGTPYGASLSFATTTHLWPLPDPPSREPTDANSRQQAARSIPSRALASSMLDSPCQGSRTGLTPPISTSVPSTLAPLAATRLRSARRRHYPATRHQPPPLTTGGPMNGVRPLGLALGTDDQQSSAIALDSLLLLGRATLCVYVGRVAAPREEQQSADAGPFTREQSRRSIGTSCRLGSAKATAQPPGSSTPPFRGMKISFEGCCSGSAGVGSADRNRGSLGERMLGRPVWTMGVLSPGFSVAAPATCPVALRARIRRCRLPTASPVLC